MQKPVTYSKSLVHLSKVSIYVNEHFSAIRMKGLLSLFTNKIVKMLSHIVNITMHSVSITWCKLWQQFGWQILLKCRRQRFSCMAYAFQKYKFTHYCKRDIYWKRLFQSAQIAQRLVHNCVYGDLSSIPVSRSFADPAPFSPPNTFLSALNCPIQ